MAERSCLLTYWSLMARAFGGLTLSQPFPSIHGPVSVSSHASQAQRSTTSIAVSLEFLSSLFAFLFCPVCYNFRSSFSFLAQVNFAFALACLFPYPPCILLILPHQDFVIPLWSISGEIGPRRKCHCGLHSYKYNNNTLKKSQPKSLRLERV